MSETLAADARLLADTVREAGALGLSLARKPGLKRWSKPDGSEVSEGDLAINELFEQRLRAARPSDGWLSEETPDRPDRLAQQRLWIIDPIDGTRAFISGVPAWGTLIGLRQHGRPVAGLVHQPYLEETFAGSGTEGWFERRGERRPLRARQDARLADAILYCTHPSMFRSGPEIAAFERVSAAVRMSRFGGDCYSYCLLALGLVDLVVESDLQSYDIQPLIPIIHAAGGVVSGPRGEDASGGGFVVAAANPELHAEALALIAAA